MVFIVLTSLNMNIVLDLMTELEYEMSKLVQEYQCMA